ncbi:hypothetical protein SKAU_G00395730 [Synaphobranchus kaupii]|uniref:Uncharacterized protein n=1 Tax=Synaphobranchus kaupii TaxID=118154 RepID=A0A9Q1ECG9_SYNKA|nr:hypothetical protein SKAU_G00395730 [Synaphobranchus kaupii]
MTRPWPAIKLQMTRGGQGRMPHARLVLGRLAVVDSCSAPSCWLAGVKNIHTLVRLRGIFWGTSPPVQRAIYRFAQIPPSRLPANMSHHD